MAQETNLFLTTRFLFFQNEAVPMDSTNNAHSLHNQETRSEEDFTSSASREPLLTPLFDESTEQVTYNADDNNSQTVPTDKMSSANCEFKQTSADIQSAPLEDIEEETELEPQGLLLWALRSNKFEMFSYLLTVPGVDPNFKYEKPDYTTCVELACRLHWGGKFVKILLEHGAKTNVHEIHQEPIHYAARYGNPEALEALLQNKRTKINVLDSSGRTALHHAVKYTKKWREAEYERCIELLLKRPDLVLNIPNNSGYTAGYEAANFNKKAVELILKYRQDDVDLDSYRTRGRTARECILRKYPELEPLLPKYQIKFQSVDSNSQLLLALQNRQLETFRNILCQVDEDGKSRVDLNHCYGRPHFATCLEIACKGEDCAEFVKELLRAGADPNFVNPKTEKTALHLAVEERNIQVLLVLLEDRRTNVNAIYDDVVQMTAELDKQTDNEVTMQEDEEEKRHKNAMQKLQRILHIRISEIRGRSSTHANQYNSSLGQELFKHLYDRNYEDFWNNFSEECKDTTDGQHTLLQYATLHRLRDVVQLLLERGADPNATTERETRSPILLASMNKDHEIMNLLLSSATNNKLDVNVTDVKGNTPLHHLSNTEYLDCVVELMRRGADIKHKNVSDKSPLPAKSVGNFLDMSLQTNGIPPENEEYKIFFDYSFLVAHKEKRTQPNLLQEDGQHFINDYESGSRNVQFPEKLNPEMDFLFYISQSNEHRNLMQHPIIKSFLHIKWQHVKIYCYINIFMYSIFAILLNSYILLKIRDNAMNGRESGVTSNDTKTSHSHSTSPGFEAARVFILLFLLYFTVRELLQLILSPKVYHTNYENYLDISLIFFSGYILICSEWQETFIVITIILSWTEMILLTGRLPKLSRNIEMLKSVSLNYFWFLLSYLFLLIAFAFSFYSLLHKNATNSSTYYHDRHNENFFMNPIMSVMKTFVMMMGEFEVGSMASEMANSTTYFCLFALFVFVIAMVLLNLLTGLAVSDTQTIKSDAEQLSLVSRIRLIYDIESTLLQWYNFVGKWPKYTLLRPFTDFQKSKIKSISLFPGTSYKEKIHVLPNKGPNIVFDGNELNEGEGHGHAIQAYGWWESRVPCFLNLCTKRNVHNTSCKMPSVIIGEATRIISKRSESDVNNTKENLGQMQETLKEHESKFSKIENKMEELFEKILAKLDAVESKVEHNKIQSKNKDSENMNHNATTSHRMENTPHERWSPT